MGKGACIWLDTECDSGKIAGNAVASAANVLIVLFLFLIPQLPVTFEQAGENEMETYFSKWKHPLMLQSSTVISASYAGCSRWPG